MSATISVIIPFYQVEQYIGACLESVLGQSFRDIEVICVDDGGTDGSRAIVDRYARIDSRVRVLEPGGNRGIGPARNAGMDAMCGRYFLFVDSDDLLPPEALREMLSALEAAGADMATGRFSAFADENCRDLLDSVASLNAGFACFHPQDVQVDLRNFQRMLDITYGVACGKLFRTEYMLRKGIRFLDSPVFHEDKGFFLKCIASLPHIVCIDSLVMLYRVRNGSTMTLNTPMQKARRKRDIVTAVRDGVEHIYAMHDKELADRLVAQVKSHRSFAPHFDKRRLGGLVRLRWYHHEKLVELCRLELYREKVRRDGVKIWRFCGLIFHRERLS